MQLFYNPEITSSSQEIYFPKDESRHMVKVLRMGTGQKLTLTNGKGSFFTAEILRADPKNCRAKIISETRQQGLPYYLHLAVAPTKMNDRYEWFLEKATEIGIAEITPIICEHSERRLIKPDRFEKILQSAMKQSLKAYLPRLNPAVSFTDFIGLCNDAEGLKCIAHCGETHRQSLKNVLRPKQKSTILIGPEGDFSSAEVQLALSHGYIPVALGDSRLRTETAAIVACHSVAFVNE